MLIFLLTAELLLQILVLKQSWRPIERNSEGYFYNFAKGSETKFIGAILGCEDSMIEDEKDETSCLTRESWYVTFAPSVAPARERVREWALTWEMKR